MKIHLLLALATWAPTAHAKQLTNRRLAELTTVKFGLCEGDCDYSSDCDFGLNCFQRDGTEAVPGCTGTGTSGTDYCYAPPAGELVIAGDEDEPASAFPLGECQGDCDDDTDCDWGLLCFQRSGNEAVPGCTGSGISEKDYCYKPPAGTLVEMGDEDVPAANFPLGECEGDCDDDTDCEGTLRCFERSGTEAVPGCNGTGRSGKDYCFDPANLPPTPSPVSPPTPSPVNLPTPSPVNPPTPSPVNPPTPSPVNPVTPSPVESGPPLTFIGDELSSRSYGLCEGDCDSDRDCDWGLNCFQRDGTEAVPGCSGTGSSGTDYCYAPSAGELVLVGNNNNPASAFPLQECQADCDSDRDCDWGLICFQRTGDEPVPGCTGPGLSTEDYCIKPAPGTLVEMGNDGSPAANFPLGNCEGDCDNDSECAGSLKCFQRSGSEAVPGCSDTGRSGIDYCYDPSTPQPTPSPVVSGPTPAPVPTVNQCPNGDATYFPGDLTKTLGGGLATSTLKASTGLSGRVLTREGQTVSLNEGTSQSSETMHSNADGAATVPDDSNPNRYYLISNSESGSGGVGIIHFDATTTPHDIIGYRRTAQNTNTGSRNCGGGRTPWGTWLTSEESGTGSVYEIDPNEPAVSDYCRSPIVPSSGGNYESNAFWEAPDNKYHFYTTEDASSNYRLTRFIPDDTIPTMLAKPRKLDRLCGASGTHTYLKMSTDGTYSWANSRTPDSGDQAYPNAEGIDVKGNQMYFITKGQRRLYILDLDGNTWTSTQTIQSDGGAEFSPDQVARITGSNSPDDLLYFTEDGSGTQDIHARGLDENGDYKFFTIIEGYSSTETVGLTFSPDNKYMYFGHQANSEIWQIWREDGCTFGNGIYLDVNYHDIQARYLRAAPQVGSEMVVP